MRAIEKDLACCPTCLQIIKLSKKPSKLSLSYCPRCGSEVHQRKPQSLQNTLALLIASIIFYIPANVLPMMRIDSFTGNESDTIMSGIIYFIENGSYFVGSVIFIASILVPVLKILTLLYLLYRVHKHQLIQPKMKQRLHRLTELVGRWSMVDLYVVSIMVALVNFGAISQIHAEVGSIFFLLVVVLTMLAAMSFDSRLIWDNTKEYYG